MGVMLHAACSSGRAGAAYGAVYRAGEGYFGFLLGPVPARKILRGNKK